MITKWEELMMPVTSRQPRRLIDAELGQVLALAKDADSVELKLAVPDASAARPSPHWAWAPWKPRSGRCTSSTPPTQGFQVASETRAFLSGQGVDSSAGSRPRSRRRWSTLLRIGKLSPQRSRPMGRLTAGGDER